MSSIAVTCGLIILVLLVIMLLAGVPIAVALAVSSIAAILPVLNTGAAVLTGAQRIFSGISVFSLLAIPFFILAGNLMNKGGIAIRLINFAKLFTGRIPGALAHTNAVANMLFGAISGSGTAAASAMGSIIGPIEEEEGYDRDFSAAANIATAPTGLLIPPSNVMITYSLVSGGTSVAALFMAGYIPGILWGLACMIVIYIFAKKKGYASTKRFTNSEKIKVFFQAIPCLLMIIIVIGGIISGIFTATEGSVVAVVYSLILSLFFYRSIKVSELPKIFLDSAEMTGLYCVFIPFHMRSSFPHDSVPKNRYLSYHTIAHLANHVPPRAPPAGGIAVTQKTGRGTAFAPDSPSLFLLTILLTKTPAVSGSSDCQKSPAGFPPPESHRR